MRPSRLLATARSRYGSKRIGVLALILCACRSAPATPKPSPPPLKDSKTTPGLSTTQADAISAALRDANALEIDAAEWVLEGVHSVAGIAIESYRLGDRLLLFTQDSSSHAVSYETWIPIEGAPFELDLGEADRFLENARWRPGDPNLREIESLGAIVGQGVREGLAYLRTVIPIMNDRASSGLSIVIAAEASRLVAATQPGQRTSPPKRHPNAWIARSAMERALRETIAGAPIVDRASLHPSRAIWSVAGRAKRRELLTELRRIHGSSPSREGADRGATPESSHAADQGSPGTKRGPREMMIEIPAEGLRLLIGWPIPPVSHEDHWALQAIAHLLAEGEESRLAKALLPARAQSIESSALPTESSGIFEIFLALPPSQTSTDCVALVEHEIRAIARGETTGIELEIARESVRGRILRDIDRLEDRAGAIARARLFDRRIDAYGRRLSAASELTETRIRAAASRYLTSTNRALVIGRPRIEEAPGMGPGAPSGVPVGRSPPALAPNEKKPRRNEKPRQERSRPARAHPNPRPRGETR